MNTYKAKYGKTVNFRNTHKKPKKIHVKLETMRDETWLVMGYTRGVEGVERPEWVVFDHHTLEDAKQVFDILKKSYTYTVVILTKVLEESRINGEERTTVSKGERTP